MANLVDGAVCTLAHDVVAHLDASKTIIVVIATGEFLTRDSLDLGLGGRAGEDGAGDTGSVGGGHTGVTNGGRSTPATTGISGTLGLRCGGLTRGGGEALLLAVVPCSGRNDH